MLCHVMSCVVSRHVLFCVVLFGSVRSDYTLIPSYFHIRGITSNSTFAQLSSASDVFASSSSSSSSSTSGTSTNTSVPTGFSTHLLDSTHYKLGVGFNGVSFPAANPNQRHQVSSTTHTAKHTISYGCKFPHVLCALIILTLLSLYFHPVSFSVLFVCLSVLSLCLFIRSLICTILSTRCFHLVVI